MSAANDKISYAESAARQYNDLDSARKRLIELEKTRIFSDEDLALLIRKSAHTNLKEGFESQTLNRKYRASSNRTTGGRTVIRSWAPADVDVDIEIDQHAALRTNSEQDISDGWREFVAATKTRTQARESVQKVHPAFERARLRRPNRLKSMQNRNLIITLLANFIFIPKQAVVNLVGLVVPSVGRRAC